MMNIFDSLKTYETKWELVDSRDFTEGELNQVSKAVVVPSNYGMSVQFTMVKGGVTYIPTSNKATFTEGEVLDLKDCLIERLHRDGEGDINRIMNK